MAKVLSVFWLLDFSFHYLDVVDWSWGMDACGGNERLQIHTPLLHFSCSLSSLMKSSKQKLVPICIVCKPPPPPPTLPSSVLFVLLCMGDITHCFIHLLLDTPAFPALEWLAFLGAVLPPLHTWPSGWLHLLPRPPVSGSSAVDTFPGKPTKESPRWLKRLSDSLQFRELPSFPT